MGNLCGMHRSQEYSICLYKLSIQLTQYFSGFADYIIVKLHKYNLRMCTTKAEYGCNYMYNVLWAECIAHKQ